MTTTIEGVLRWDAGGPGVRFERRYDTSPEDLWAAVTTPERLARWFHPVAGDLREGGRFRIDFGEGGVTTGTVLVCAPPSRLETTWDFTGESESALVVQVLPDAGGAVLVLDHSRLPAGQAAGYGAGWHTYLDHLEDDVRGAAPGDWDHRWAELAPRYRQQLDALGAGS
jgi:uncharacterized protein YndB with AHSA1/START domain